MAESELRQAIVEAALARYPEDGMPSNFVVVNASAQLQEAVAAYRRATTPQPFDWFAGFTNGVLRWLEATHEEHRADTVWRCTVTPIEGVR